MHLDHRLTQRSRCRIPRRALDRAPSARGCRAHLNLRRATRTRLDPHPSLGVSTTVAAAIWRRCRRTRITSEAHRGPPDVETDSRRAPTGSGDRPPRSPRSRAGIVVSFRCVSSGSHMFVFSSHTRPAHSETSTAALTTPALDRRSLRWFGISACTATPEDLPPSLAQHGSCRRSSTSSSLPFRTHMGAGNSAVVVDLPRWGPMLSPRVPNLVPIPGPRMERETPGQRPRPNYGHPQVTSSLRVRMLHPSCRQRRLNVSRESSASSHITRPALAASAAAASAA